MKQWIRQRCHWQNLNDKRGSDRQGSILRHGRAWFHRKWKDDTKDRRNIEACWSVWTHFFGADVRLCGGDSDRDITFFFGCGLFALWVTFEAAFPRKLKDRIQYGSALRARIVHTIEATRHQQWNDRDNGGDIEAYSRGVLIDPVLDNLVAYDPALSRQQYDDQLKGLFDDGIIQMRTNDRGEYRINTVYEKTTDYWSREVGINFHSGSVWVSLWKPDGHWSRSEPRWWSFSFNPADFFLGRTKYTKREIKKESAIVPMPEASYPATVTILEETWKRPRWPFATRRVASRIEVESGVPVPGKGENSWDCGEDAIFSTSSSDPTVSGAVAQMVKSALETRVRYGGKNWVPERVR